MRFTLRLETGFHRYKIGGRTILGVSLIMSLRKKYKLALLRRNFPREKGSRSSRGLYTAGGQGTQEVYSVEQRVFVRTTFSR